MPRMPTGRAREPGPVLLAAIALVASCSPSRPEVRHEAAGGSRDDGVRGAEAPPAQPDSVESSGLEARLRYDLAAHLERAEIRQGATLIADLGMPGGAKYTLGGWLTSMRGPVEVDGTSCAVLEGRRGRLALPWDGRGPASVALRVRALARTELRLWVNGEQVAQRGLTPGAFEVVSFEVAEDQIRRGENTLLLRVGGTGSVPGIPSAGLLIDWMRIGSGTLPDAEPTRPERLGAPVDGHAALSIPPGTRLGYVLLVPPAARLRALVRSAGGALLAVEAHRDGHEPVLLETVGADTRGAPLDLDLGPLAGQVVRLDLSAVRGTARLVEPAVVTLEHPAPASRAQRARNAIIYLVDTLRVDKLAAYAPSTRVRTPGLDRFAETAITMRSAHSQENWTKPSVATLLSGLMPWQHTAVREESVLPSSVRVLPEILAERGFHTGAFIANGYVSDRFGFRQGWATYRNYIREGRRTEAEHVAADVLRWLDDRPSDRPFFLYVHAIDPHVPYRPPSDFLAMYDPEPYRGPVDFRRDATLLENIKAGRIRLAERDRRHLEALYDGEISYHDVHFDAIMRGLERRDLMQDTMVVITADHGEEFWDHGSVGHGHSVYEELLHVPLFVRVPGLATGEVRAPVGLVDVVPTVLSVLGEEVPADLAGRSFLPELLGEDLAEPRVVVSGFMDAWRTVVVGHHKLVHRTAERVALYDLDADPQERTDLAPEHPILVRYARGLLGIELARTGSTGDGPTGERAPTHRPADIRIDPETAAQLRALGYVNH